MICTVLCLISLCSISIIEELNRKPIIFKKSVEFGGYYITNNKLVEIPDTYTIDKYNSIDYIMNSGVESGEYIDGKMGEVRVAVEEETFIDIVSYGDNEKDRDRTDEIWRLYLSNGVIAAYMSNTGEITVLGGIEENNEVRILKQHEIGDYFASENSESDILKSIEDTKGNDISGILGNIINVDFESNGVREELNSYIEGSSIKYIGVGKTKIEDVRNSLIYMQIEKDKELTCILIKIDSSNKVYDIDIV